MGVVNRAANGFGNTNYCYENKVKEYEYYKGRRENGKEAYNPRKLDLKGNILKQVKEYLKQGN